MFLAFRADGAMDWRDQLKISLKHVGSQHKLQFHHIFPQGVLTKLDLSNQQVNDICNLSFISGSTNRKISAKEPAKYLPTIIENIGKDALAKQCIPSEPRYWSLDNYSLFVEKRRELVAERLNQFLDHSPGEA